ncbi:hypothetical protein [Acetobacter orientalis]|uniref:hypothetical protein n=1 Tax=Acetobacter orientalis TaxID=146474 RepID=UPI0015C4FF0D|nr:hypothetical protein [Acetobacter orientalis]
MVIISLCNDRNPALKECAAYSGVRTVRQEDNALFSPEKIFSFPGVLYFKQY